MIKAEYRRTNAFDAPGHSTPVVEGDRASTVEVLRTLPEGSTGAELLREIERLFEALQALPAGRRADRAVLETQIRRYADRFKALEPGGWTAVSPPLPRGGDRTTSRRFFRTASEPHPRLTRVW
jgi:hypothetical protein